MSITLGGVRVLSVDLYQFWKGPWIADCVLDPDTPASMPSGRVALSIQSGEADALATPITLVGTIDPNFSGSFSAKGSARVVGGAGGWDSILPTQNYHSDNGNLSTPIYQQTAQQVGETVNDLLPTLLGVDIIRPAGPAAQIFQAPWWVDFTGVTQVGARPSASPDSTFQLLDFDPIQSRVEFSADAPLIPGTSLTDPRLNGATLVARDVYQHFGHAKGARGVAMCGTATTSRLQAALLGLIQASTPLLKAYRYRVIQYQNNRLALQAVNTTEGVPNLIPLTPWYGLPGVTAQAASSSQVVVIFDHSQEPPQPISVAYDSQAPAVSLSLFAEAVSIGSAGGDFLIQKIPYTALLQALSTLASSLGSAASVAQVAAAGAVLTTALGQLPPPATQKTRAS